MRIDRDRDALVVVDVQHDFLPGGALAVGTALRATRKTLFRRSPSLTSLTQILSMVRAS